MNFSVPDLMSFLKDKYEQELRKNPHTQVLDPHGAVSDFLRFSRTYLGDNIPNSVFYLSRGFGLNFPDGNQVVLSQNQTDPHYIMDTSMPITRPMGLGSPTLDANAIDI